MEALDAEEARLERRLKEIMKEDDARMPDISHDSQDSRPTGSPIGESDLVKHYKSLFFARNSNGTSTMPNDDSGYSNTPTPKSTISSKYKTNIVPPHMKRPSSKHKQSTISRKLNTSLMSSLPPEEIPVYFSPPALARMQRPTPQPSPVQPQDSPQNSTRGAQQDGTLDSTESKGEEPSVLQSEYEELQTKLEEAEARLKDFEQQSEKIEELERQIEDLQDTKLDAKGMSVGLQRQLTNLTTERQRFLLVRDISKWQQTLTLFRNCVIARRRKRSSRR